MITRKILRCASALYSIFILPVSGHMEMSWPYPLRSKYNPANSYNIIDYSMTSPLDADGSNFPCKGYQNDRPIETVTTYLAGSTYNLTLAGSATHGGGSCQLSLSYDNGATFRVIKSMIGGCPLTDTYDFTIPLYAPSGTALLAWTWQNFEGNREFYMNCAEVSILSSARRKKKRQTYASFDQLPFIWKANLAGVNTCATSEGDSPVYPNPGPEVEYGGGMSSSSPPTPGTCDAPTPYGQSYQDLGDSDLPPSPASAPAWGSISSSKVPVESPYAPPTSSNEDVGMLTETSAMDYKAATASESTSAVSEILTAAPTLNADKQRQAAASSQSYSTTTLFVDCLDTITMTIYPPTSSTATVTVRSRPSSRRSSQTTTRTTSHSSSRRISSTSRPHSSSTTSSKTQKTVATHTATVVPVPGAGTSDSTGQYSPSLHDWTQKTLPSLYARHIHLHQQVYLGHL